MSTLPVQRSRRGGWWLLLVCAALRGETLTVATYNVENYGPANRVTDAGYRQDYPKPEAEKAALRSVIRALRADVLVLQEMGGRPFLDELRRDLKTEGCDYAFAEVAVAADADRHLAILSRRPLTSVRTHTDLGFAYLGGREAVKRGLLEASFLTEAGPITVFVVHLKSRYTDRADDPTSAVRRAAEAVAVRDRVLQRVGEAGHVPFILLGDCNDGRTTRTLAALQKRGKREIARLLPATDSRGETWTHAFRREDSYSRVDHILVSPGLFDAVEGGSAQIFDEPATRTASDHRPVYVVLRLEPRIDAGRPSLPEIPSDRRR